MELLQLKYFCDAAETENFSKTAEKFYVPTSNISQSVKRLEKELGCELFEHYANKIRLNDEGKQFYSYVSEALVLLENAKACIVDRGDEVRGDIGIVCLSSRRIVTSAMEAFLLEYPEVNLTVHHNLEAAPDFDIFISDVCPFEYSEKTLLVDEKICVAMNAKHFLASKSEIHPSDLENERFISMTSGSSLYKLTVNICASAGFVPDISIQTDDPYYLRKYVDMGLGIAFVPSVSWRGLFPENIVLRDLDNIRRKVYAFLPRRKRVKASVRAFLEQLQNTKAAISI